MKIIWLCNYSPHRLQEKLGLKANSSSHPATWLYYLSMELRNRKGVELNIITVITTVEKDYFFRDESINYYILQKRPKYLPKILFKIVSKITPGIWDVLLKRRTKKIVKKIDPDIINLHGTETPFGALINKLNYPSLVSMQGLLHRIIKVDNNHLLNKMLKNEDKIFKHQRNFVSVRGNMEEIILDHNTEAKFYHLSYPISELAFQLHDKQVEQIDDIVFVGALVKRKGIEDLIEALQFVKKEIKDIKVKVIGYTSTISYIEILREKIEKYNLSENVKLLGFIDDHNDVMREIKSSKILVLPTHVDVRPNVVAESMAIGVPVISNNLDGLPEMIENEVNGILVEKGDIRELAKQIIRLLKNPGLRNELSAEAYKFAKENFDTVKAVNNLIPIYQEIINTHHEKLINNFSVKTANT